MFNFIISFQEKQKYVLNLTISLMPLRSAYAIIEIMTWTVNIFWKKYAITIAVMATTLETTNRLQNQAFQMN